MPALCGQSDGKVGFAALPFETAFSAQPDLFLALRVQT
jgi:hypothetical protein